MLTAALGQGDICVLNTLWDGQTDYSDSLTITLDVQAGDLVEINLSFAAAGCFEWTCNCQSGDITFVSACQGFYTGLSPTDLTSFDDRTWVSLVNSNATQTITLAITHIATPASGPSGPGPTPGYRVGNVALGASVIGRNY